jgi:hypothetical protein
MTTNTASQSAQLAQLRVSFQQPGHDQPRNAARVTEQTSNEQRDMMCNYFNGAPYAALAKSTPIDSAFQRRG